MDIQYTSTRNRAVKVTASQAIIKGLSEDGGLFVPTEFPKLMKSMEELSWLDYKGIAYEVMKLFLTDFSEEELKSCIEKAYDSKFDDESIAPMAYADGNYYLELFHGKTIAFKDMALSILPHLMTVAAKKNNVDKKIVILTATSGDTGKAALAGFAGVPGTGIVVFYPKYGVSAIQEKQMVTQVGDNVKVIGITGNFDDAQTGVKKIFADKELEKELADRGYQFSSANSINIGRLVPQIVYYTYAYAKLLEQGKIQNNDEINFVVPTGNFGNILAGYYAKMIGVPIKKLICASNENKVLFDFFTTGEYNRKRDFILTTSPSMDILISSNLERLIYLIADSDADTNAGFMKQLIESGQYTITDAMKDKLQDFYGGYATTEQTAKTIHKVYEECGYVIDPHTAVASTVYEEYKKQTGDNTIGVVVSTASPYKFTRSVMEAIKGVSENRTDFELIDELAQLSATEIPQAVEEIRNAPVLHDTVCDKEDMKQEVLAFLG